MRTRRSVLASTLLLVAGMVAGCGGSDSTGPDGDGLYLRFKLNGTQVSYTNPSTLYITMSNSGGQYLAVITGYDATTNANVQVYSGSAIGEETYSGYSVVGTALTGALIGYENASGVVYSTGGGQIQVSVTISHLDATRARGTFTGLLRSAGQPDLQVTDGEFHVQRLN